MIWTHSVITVSGIILVGLFFGFEHIRRLREYTLEYRKENAQVDKRYKDWEKKAYRILIISIAGFMITIMCGVNYLYASIIQDNASIQLKTIILGVFSTVTYGAFLISSIFVIFFLLFIRELVSFVK